jgi:hypothetical protein
MSHGDPDSERQGAVRPASIVLIRRNRPGWANPLLGKCCCMFRFGQLVLAGDCDATTPLARLGRRVLAIGDPYGISTYQEPARCS